MMGATTYQSLVETNLGAATDRSTTDLLHLEGRRRALVAPIEKTSTSLLHDAIASARTNISATITAPTREGVNELYERAKTICRTLGITEDASNWHVEIEGADLYFEEFSKIDSFPLGSENYYVDDADLMADHVASLDHDLRAHGENELTIAGNALPACVDEDCWSVHRL